MEWLVNNLATIIISLILAVIAGLIIYKMAKDKKQGKSSCGCNCSCCPMGSACHGGDKDIKKT